MDVDSGGIDFAGFNDIGEILACVLPPEHGIERKHDPGVEIDAVAQARQRFPGCIGDAKAAGARSAREFNFQRRRAILEIMQRLRIGLRGIRMIDPLHDLPGCGGSAPGNGRSTLGAAIDRIDPDAVIGLADQLFERRALQHAVDELLPVILGGRRKVRGQPHIIA